jgi:hypothetical protein
LRTPDREPVVIELTARHLLDDMAWPQIAPLAVFLDQATASIASYRQSRRRP